MKRLMAIATVALATAPSFAMAFEGPGAAADPFMATRAIAFRQPLNDYFMHQWTMTLDGSDRNR